MCVSLPNPKFISCTKTIQDMLSKDKTKSKKLVTLIVSLNNTSLIIPLARNFLERIWLFQSKMKSFAWYQLRPSIRDDLKLHTRILQKACKGILMNLLTYRELTCIYLTDACKIGIGGLSSKVRAWRWQIPK